MVYLISGIALVVVLALLILAALQVDDWSRDLTTNRAATDPDAHHPLMRSLAQRFTLAELDAVLAAICQDDAAWSMPAPPKPLPIDSQLPVDRAETTHHLVRQTGLGFRDDIWIVVEPVEDEKRRLWIESRSRIGRGDLGQNPRNLRELNGRLLERLIMKVPPPKKR